MVNTQSSFRSLEYLTGYSRSEQRHLRSTRPLEFVLGTVLPGLIILVTIIYDFLSPIRLPKHFRKALSSLASPFHNFLTVEDLDDVFATQPQPAWKIRTLSLLALTHSLGWLAYFMYTCVVQEDSLAIDALIGCATWVRNCNPCLSLCTITNT